MDQAGIIRDLLIWLEGHLDQPLSLDNVAAKAGYSKWHLQRMFKDVTGHAIGAYIRARRLSKSAVALRLDPRVQFWILLFSTASILSKPLRAPLRNSFPRRQRCIVAPRNGAPLAFARHYGWASLPCRNISSLRWEDTPLLGVTQSYSCSLEQISDFRHEMRVQFWHDFLGHSPNYSASALWA
ncbi:right origin-binding protein [Salmonella enterica subsp. enterica]|nr:right origin-binding protein [Salmonella enterica subsp. enterica] [Salmonella enterica subsp. enterica serovar Menston]